MARLTVEQWIAARADFEIADMGITEIADKYGVSKSTVSERAKKDGWERGKTEQAKQSKTNAIIALAEVSEQTERTLNRTEQIVFDRVVGEALEFRLQSDERMQRVEDKVMELLPLVERPSDAKLIMETLRIHREARLGKSPDNQVNIQNTSPSAITIDVVSARKSHHADFE